MSASPAPRPATTLAIALAEGASNDDEIPRVTATGRGAVAEQIIAIALDHGVKLRRDADLAGVLAALDIDSPIPLGALSTVTGILTYVHRSRYARRRQRRRRYWPAAARRAWLERFKCDRAHAIKLRSSATQA